MLFRARKSKIEAERQVDEKMKMLRDQMEYDKRAKLEKDIEDKLRPSAAAMEREARARMEKEAEHDTTYYTLKSRTHI